MTDPGLYERNWGATWEDIIENNARREIRARRTDEGHWKEVGKVVDGGKVVWREEWEKIGEEGVWIAAWEKVKRINDSS
jgi:hypothetical protein